MNMYCQAYNFIFQNLFLSINTFLAQMTFFMLHTSSVGRFSENVDDKVVTYLIFFVWTHWFQKCNFWKHSLAPFWGRRGRWGQTTSKLKTVKNLNGNSSKIDGIQILASAIVHFSQCFAMIFCCLGFRGFIFWLLASLFSHILYVLTKYTLQFLYFRCTDTFCYGIWQGLSIYPAIY